MDSHADTCAVGNNFVMLRSADDFISVHPFAEEYKPLWNISISTVLLQLSGLTVRTKYTYWSFIEHFSLATDCNTLLFCPNHLHANGLTVHDVPHQFDSNSMHSIHIPDVDLHLPLSLSGVVSVFHTLTPTSADLDNLPCIAMTSSDPWNPNLPSFAATEETYKVSSMNSQQGDANLIADMNLPHMIAPVNMLNTMFHDTPTLKLSHDQDDLHNHLIAQVCVRLDLPTTSADANPETDPDPYYLEALHTTSSLSTKSSKPAVTPEMLSSK